MTTKESELKKMSVHALRTRCKELTLDQKGLKSTLVHRLAAHYKSAAEKEAEEAEVEEEETETAAEKTEPAAEKIRHGVVETFRVAKGYGFIKPDEEEGAADNENKKIFVHVNNVTVADGEEKILRQGMRVQYRAVSKDNKKFAENVKGEDGEPLSWWKKNGDSDRTILDGEHDGIIGEFRFTDSRGYVLLNEPVVTEDGTVQPHTRLDVWKPDFKTKGDKPFIAAGRKVKFKLCKNPSSEKFGATNVTASNGEPIGAKDADFELKIKDIPDNKRFTGRVLQFKVNAHGFVAADEDELITGNTKLYFKPEDINTEERPAVVVPGQKVSFDIRKVTQRGREKYEAAKISAVDGEKITLSEDMRPRAYADIMERERFPDLEFEGKVTKFFWDRGFGYIKIDTDKTPIPEEHKDSIKNGDVYFHWDDLKSEDKAVGANIDLKVKFNLYKDEKGFGAENITKEDGATISGQEYRRTAQRGGYQRGGYQRGWGNQGGYFGGFGSNFGVQKGWGQYGRKRRGQFNSWGNRNRRRYY